MSWREDAISDIKVAEGLRLEAYQDSVGMWTNGYGHTRDVTPGQTIAQATADGWLEADIAIAEGDLDSHAGWWKIAPDPVRRGVLNMCFNLGWPRLSGFREMLVCAEREDWAGMALAALDSKWAKQVGGRADFIAGLFRSADGAGELAA